MLKSVRRAVDATFRSPLDQWPLFDPRAPSDRQNAEGFLHRSKIQRYNRALFFTNRKDLK